MSQMYIHRERRECIFAHSIDSIFVLSDGNVPNPVKIIRRLTALELAMGQLRKDCATISQKRHGVVKSVVAQQSTNVENIEQVSGGCLLACLPCLPCQ